MTTLAIWCRDEAEVIAKAALPGMHLICVTNDTKSGVGGLWAWLDGNYYAVESVLRIGGEARPRWAILPPGQPQ